jgi:hypothetical protein
MNRRSRNIFIAVIAPTLEIWLVVFVGHHKREPELARSEVRAVAPQFADKLEEQVARLKRESVAESVAKLSDVNMFYSPGPPIEEARTIALPLAEDVGQSDLEAIMSSRRFRKLFEEISKLDKAAASKMVCGALSAAITEYLPMYDAEMRRFAPHYKLEKLDGLNVISGPTFEIVDVPEGKIVVKGARLKVLALVWTSGMLGLSSCKDQVEHVARLAVKQRTDLYDDPTLHPFFKQIMLSRASLYNRQVISSGLLGAAANGNLSELALKLAGGEWRERRLALYTAAVTEFDLPVRSGILKPDYLQGSLKVKFVSPMNDAHFDILLKEMHVVP